MLDFAPIQRSINEYKLEKDFEDFSTRMRIRWNSRDELSKILQINQHFNQNPSHPGLELFQINLKRKSLMAF